MRGKWIYQGPSNYLKYLEFIWIFSAIKFLINIYNESNARIPDTHNWDDIAFKLYSAILEHKEAACEISPA